MIRNLFFFLLITLTLTISAQTRDELNTLFDSAIIDYNNLQYLSSQGIFDTIANAYPLNSKTSLALLFLGKTNLELKRYSDAEKNLLRLINDFPQSKYSDEAHITLSKVYLEQKEYSESFFELCTVLAVSKNSETKDFAGNTAEKIALNFLSAGEIQSVHDTTKFLELKPFLLLLSGKIQLAKQNYQEALTTFTKVVRLYPNSNEKDEALRLSDETLKPRETVNESSIIGVILPLSSSQSASSAASEVLEGIKYALSEYNEEHENRIGILIRDSRLDKTKLEEISNEFQDIRNLKCILGPIYSSEVKNALELFRGVENPIISPTATEDYLTDLNENFFQANPSFTTRGRLMAQYLYFVENKRKIAILNAIDGYSPILSTSFSQEFEKLGGMILLRENYKSRSTDLTEQVTRISQVLNQVEGIYVPLADKIDIPVLLSFLSQIDLNIPIYGDQDWMSATGLETAAFLDSNLIFCSDYFLKFDDLDYQNFSKDFLFKTKIDVNRNILYGYDTMKYLLTIIRSSFSSGIALKQKMISGISSTGFHNNICFNSNRINRYLNIVRYSSGRFELINKFKMNN
jgi:branched-chain amino acid transport system substrate-binding protein